jgi:hypothetical protein
MLEDFLKAAEAVSSHLEEEAATSARSAALLRLATAADKGYARPQRITRTAQERVPHDLVLPQGPPSNSASSPDLILLSEPNRFVIGWAATGNG